MSYCPNCGATTEDGKKFCRNCGYSLEEPEENASTLHLPEDNLSQPQPPPSSEEAGTLPLSESPENIINDNTEIDERTWHLPAVDTGPVPESKRPTSPVSQGTTGPANIFVEPPYPPVRYTTPPQPPAYQYPPPYYQPPQEPVSRTVSLGEWLAGGWKVYKENGAILSAASFIGLLLSVVSAGFLSGPLLLGLYRMAFKSMRGEKPEMNDLFNWKGHFLQAFLVSILSVATYSLLLGAGNNSPFFVLINFLVSPILTIFLGFTLPMILDRKMDIAAAINEVGKQMFSRDALMWWVVGLVFYFIIPVGCIGCGFGFFITFPWILCSAAYGYSRFFGFDDPNRTLH